jgi:hypothetical protein
MNMAKHKKQAVVYLRISNYSPFTEERIVAAYNDVIHAIAHEIGAKIAVEFFDKGNSKKGFNELLSHIGQNIPENLIIIDCGVQLVLQDFNCIFRETEKAIKFVEGAIKRKAQQKRLFYDKG